jgi:hypothetical protein
MPQPPYEPYIPGVPEQMHPEEHARLKEAGLLEGIEAAADESLARWHDAHPPEGAQPEATTPAQPVPTRPVRTAEAPAPQVAEPIEES